MGRKDRHSLLLVPESKSNVHAAVAVRDASNPIFAPAEGPGAGHIVGEGAPCIAVRARVEVSAGRPGKEKKWCSSRVVLAHCRPLSLSSVWSKLLPVASTLTVFLKALFLGAEHLFVVDDNHRGRLKLPGSCSMRLGGDTELGFPLRKRQSMVRELVMVWQEIRWQKMQQKVCRQLLVQECWMVDAVGCCRGRNVQL